MVAWSRALRAGASVIAVGLLAPNLGALEPVTRAPPARKTPSSSLVTKAKGEFAAYTDTDAVTVFTPGVGASVSQPLSGWSAGGSYLVDIVSAASVDIVSTASGRWDEIRHVGALSGTYKPSTFGTSVSASVSREPDYLSLSAGASILAELSGKTVTPLLGYVFTHDDSGFAGTPFSAYDLELLRHTINGQLELVLGKDTLLTFVTDLMLERGPQEKPYRFIPIFEKGVNVPKGSPVDRVNELRLPARVTENTPDTRTRFAFSGRIAQRLLDSTFSLSERVYTDDWGLLASTTDLRFLKDIGDRFFVWAHLRFHGQSGVSFWNRAYVGEVTTSGQVTVPDLRTGDRELSPLLGFTPGVGLRWNAGAAPRPSAWSFVAQTDYVATSFSDALFITNRQGVLGILQLEMEIE